MTDEEVIREFAEIVPKTDRAALGQLMELVRVWTAKKPRKPEQVVREVRLKLVAGKN